ncbi:MAG: NADH-quinone oxidoreductase subunit I [Candidatus Gastranaerophilales bacterium]|nr:NADH-quinone oxidoreductase subunit I [Candidatus Gastranaerophilales bacterium]
MMKNLKYLISLIIGHLTVFKHIFKKPVTLEYPEKKIELNDKFRGEHAFDVEKCTACGTCQRVCPSFGTIEIEKEKDENGKFYPKNYSIDLNKCIFCGNCVQYCPFGAIKMTQNYELADEKKSTLKLEINTLKRNYFDNIIDK